MQGFEPVSLVWKDRAFEVAPDRQMELIMRVEDVLRRDDTRPAVSILAQPGGPGIARLAAAYEVALRYAGANPALGEVYLTCQEELAGEGEEQIALMYQATLGLMALLSPPMHRKIAAAVGPEKEAPTIEE